MGSVTASVRPFVAPERIDYNCRCIVCSAPHELEEEIPAFYEYKLLKVDESGERKELSDSDWAMIESDPRFQWLFTEQDAWKRKCAAILVTLQKHKFAEPFNEPVDPIVLNIPDYLNIIRHPMDLGTVKARLDQNEYDNPQQFVNDVRLVFRNAYTYNPEGSQVRAMAEALSKTFETQIQQYRGLGPIMPTATKVEEEPHTPTTRKRQGDLPSPLPPPKRPNTGPGGAPLSHSHGHGHGTGQATGSHSAGGGHADRSGDKKAKTPGSAPRPSHDWKPKAKGVLDKLVRHKMADAFKAPVDPVALGIPHYPEIIKRPMDLSTVKRKLNEDQYGSERDFNEDVELIFGNALTFNGHDHFVGQMAVKLRQYFHSISTGAPPSPGASPAP
eukprot:TRINITY_DN3383_c0_g1::TRINITY_DN3383_c0_g1_i1::g.30966::m.30966 TRINITY_DN3383_c0_g1::TRINITY_DN3383_c0_g1_i1::g.30966  ORF type:complete len:400 (+),score=50.60,sp/Q9Y7N0/BDF1_SCHPO/33.33/1e-36,sp/Q9Y7N0/BDF1_SCHPO/39.60/2e-19,sp/Q9Y7N0/BDF1_SCHPO/29.89/3e-16,Bromodomain/PF00439.20/1.8e-24,Bromodomain/PF00439.20/1.7e-20 TRINITY_DN3383_c0_g1_i1:45-1202(+)